MAEKGKVRVTLVRSTIGRLKSHIACVRGLGLRRMHHTTEVEDTPCTRGMINKVSYMLKVEETVMRLNSLQPSRGSRKPAKRVGRGMGSGSGKTCGRGHKGQGSRKSPGPRPGFEGGQMPLQRRLPKFGFSSLQARFSAQVRTGSLSKIDADVIDRDALIAAKLIGKRATKIKVIAAGDVGKAVTIKGLKATKGARALIEAAGGKVD